MIIRDVHGATSLHSAVHKGNQKIVSAILEKQLKSKFCVKRFLNKFGRCAIHLGAIKGNQDEFLSKMPDCLEIHSEDLKTALHFSVQHNQFDMVKKLVPQDKREEMAEVLSYDRDMFGNTLLHTATIKGVDPEVGHYIFLFYYYEFEDPSSCLLF
ncbi:hypothetical protein SUGI_0549560 [Cryptomeria japonica]|nr:hypothetical protein SUGI_0549560 [Cryptomeria japonica]